MSDHDDTEIREAFDALRRSVEPSVDVESARTELHAQIPPRSTRVRRVGLAMLGAAAVVVAVAVTAVLWPSDRRRNVIATGAGSKTTVESPSSGDQASCPDQVVVYMKPDSTQADADGVSAALGATDGVEEVVLINREAAYREFKKNFADQPGFADTINPDDLPVSFRATVGVPWSADELHRFEALPGVYRVEAVTGDSQNSGCAVPPAGKSIVGASKVCTEPGRVFVYMSPDSTEADADGVAAVLDVTDGVEEVVFVNREAAYREFTDLFAENPDFMNSVNPEELPESFRITRSVPWSPEELDRIKALPGVYLVEDGTETYQALCGIGAANNKGVDGLPDGGNRVTATSELPNPDGP